MLAAADPPAMEVCRKHLGVVDHDGIAAPQQARQFPHGAVLEAGAGTHDQ